MHYFILLYFFLKHDTIKVNKFGRYINAVK
nr:MAG TPA: hypothetical protein [Caudoviricetes sp.]